MDGDDAAAADAKIAAALGAVKAGSAQVKAGRRQQELKDARARRDRAIVKAVRLVGYQMVAEISGLSVTRVKQISEPREAREPH